MTQTMSTAMATVPAGGKLDEILKLAAQGWSVHPCEPGGKKPLTRWRGESTSDPETIKSWFQRWPNANIAVDTGKSGLLVLDADRHAPQADGIAAMRALEHKYGRLPDTPVARTGGGGMYAFFKMPNPGLRNSAGLLAPGIDSRGQGGYVVTSPSKLSNGGEYQWLEGHAPWEIEPAEAPEWLVQLLRGDVPQEPRERPSAGRSEAEGVIPSGRRNDELFKLGSSLRAKGLSPQAIEAALQEENRLRCVPPLSTSEVRTIAGSAGKYRPGPSVDPEIREKAQKLRAAGLDPGEFGLEVEDDPLAQISEALGVQVAEIIEERMPSSGTFILILANGRRVTLGGGKELYSFSTVRARLAELERISVRSRCKEWPGIVDMLLKQAKERRVPDPIEEMVRDALASFMEEVKVAKLEDLRLSNEGDDLAWFEALEDENGQILFRLEEFQRYLAIRQHETRISRKQLADVLGRLGFKRTDLRLQGKHQRYWKGQIPPYEALLDW